jgi:hypothetical protein
MGLRGLMDWDLKKSVHVDGCGTLETACKSMLTRNSKDHDLDFQCSANLRSGIDDLTEYNIACILGHCSLKAYGCRKVKLPRILWFGSC